MTPNSITSFLVRPIIPIKKWHKFPLLQSSPFSVSASSLSAQPPSPPLPVDFTQKQQYLLEVVRSGPRHLPPPNRLPLELWPPPRDPGAGLLLRLQLRPSIVVVISEPGGSSSDNHHLSNSLFRGLLVVVANNDDDVYRIVTRRLLEKLGCVMTPLSSEFECLAAIIPARSTAHIVLINLHMPELDGLRLTFSN